MLENKWKDYWEERTKEDGEYFGKGGNVIAREIDYLSINSKDKVLDIGCATGLLLSDIHRKTKAECYGIDISPIPIKMNKDKNIHLKIGDMESTGYEDNTFTKVISRGTFEHSPNTIKIFQELNRIMKKGGKAYFSVPNKISFFHITKNIKMILGKWDIGYERGFTLKEIKDILEKTGFELEDYWITPHPRVFNIFNQMDNYFNKINKRKFGFFYHIITTKESKTK